MNKLITNRTLILMSEKSLKRLLKDADEDTSKIIWAELNCRGIYPKGKGKRKE